MRLFFRFIFSLFLSEIICQVVPLRNTHVQCLKDTDPQDGNYVYGVLNWDQIWSVPSIPKSLKSFSRNCNEISKELCGYDSPNRKDKSICSSFTLKELSWSSPIYITKVLECDKVPCIIQPDRIMLHSLNVSSWESSSSTETDSLSNWLREVTTIETSLDSLTSMSVKTYTPSRYLMWMKALYAQVIDKKRFNSMLSNIAKPLEKYKVEKEILKSSVGGYVVKVGLEVLP